MIGPFLVLLVVIHGSSGAHFRGGSMSWRPVSGNTVQVEYTVSFKWSHKNKKFETCLSDEDGIPRNSGGKLTCDGCLPQENERKLYYVCTDLDEENDWFIGKYSFDYTVPAGQTRLVIGYEKCCWIPVVSPQISDGVAMRDGWNMITEVNIEPRPDGSINSSPVTNPIPLEKYHKACSYGLRVTVSDSDNDMIKCRNQRLDECHSKPQDRRACGKPTDGLTVNPDCTLKFNAFEAGVGDHAVNIMIEDCPDDNCASPYSKVPLLFLLNVAGEGDVCMKPTITVPPACKTIPPGRPLELVIEAEAADVSKPISHFSTTQQPDGMSVSSLQPVPGSDIKKQITISWTPRSDQIGQHSVCFSALDSDGFTSGRVCTFIRVSQTPPLSIDPAQSTPARGAEFQITEGQEWTVRFNAEIQRPNNKANIRIRDEEGRAVYSVNVLAERKVTYSGNTISFTPPKDVFPFFLNPTEHTIEIDEGAALPATGDACASGAAEWPVLLTNKVGEAIFPKGGCQEDSGPVDPFKCPLFVNEVERDESNNMVETGYKLCCTCHDFKGYGPPGRAPGHAGAGPPGNEGYGIVV